MKDNRVLKDFKFHFAFIEMFQLYTSRRLIDQSARRSLIASRVQTILGTD